MPFVKCDESAKPLAGIDQAKISSGSGMVMMTSGTPGAYHPTILHLTVTPVPLRTIFESVCPRAEVAPNTIPLYASATPLSDVSHVPPVSALVSTSGSVTMSAPKYSPILMPLSGSP